MQGTIVEDDRCVGVIDHLWQLNKRLAAVCAPDAPTVRCALHALAKAFAVLFEAFRFGTATALCMTSRAARGLYLRREGVRVAFRNARACPGERRLLGCIVFAAVARTLDRAIAIVGKALAIHFYAL